MGADRHFFAYSEALRSLARIYAEQETALVELRAIRSFLQAANLGSISKAAIQLRVTQPALSRQMRHLEKEIGVQLFVRNGRGVALTEAGEKLREEVSLIVEKLDSALSSIGSNDTSPSGSVRVGLLPNLDPHFSTDLISECKQRFPRINVVFLEGYSYQIADWIQCRRVDFGFVHDIENYRKLNVEFAFEEEAVLIGPGGKSPLPNSIPFAKLKSMPIIGAAPGSLTRRKLEKASRRCHVDLVFKYEIDSHPLIKHLASQGLGYAVLTRSSVWDAIKKGILSAASIRDPSIKFHLALVTGQGVPLSKPALSVIDLVRTIMKSYCEEQRWVGRFGSTIMGRKSDTKRATKSARPAKSSSTRRSS